MAVRLDKPWRDLNAENLARVTGHLGVYQLANDAGDILYIGVAGGRTRYGLKGEISKALDAPPPGVTKFRFEVNMSYRTRHAELLEAYVKDDRRRGTTDPRDEQIERRGKTTAETVAPKSAARADRAAKKKPSLAAQHAARNKPAK